MRDPIWVPVLAKHKRAGSFQSHGLPTRSEVLNSILVQHTASLCTHTPTHPQSYPLAKFKPGEIEALFTLPLSYSKQTSRRPTTHTLRCDTQTYSDSQTEIPTPETDSHTQELHSTSEPRAWGFGQVVLWWSGAGNSSAPESPWEARSFRLGRVGLSLSHLPISFFL